VQGRRPNPTDHLNGDLKMKIEIGSYVKISSDYPLDRTLQNQTGNIEALPNKEHPDEYLIILDGGINQNLRLTGRLIRVSAKYLELTKHN
jgi:hypothetical protein